MAGNKYLVQIEKQASLATALGVHGLQNIATSHLLKSKTLANTVSKSFNAGISGIRDKTNWTDRISGALLPEVSMLKHTARHAGEALSSKLPSMSKRDKVGLRLLARGDFDKFQRYGLHRSDQLKNALYGSVDEKARPLLDHVMSKSRLPVANLEQAWKSKSSPITSNLIANLDKHKSAVVASGPRGSAGRAIQGALATAVVDPVTGAFNATKSALMSDKLKNNKYLKPVIGFVHKKMYTDDFSHSLQAGLSGQADKHKLARIAKHYAVNPLAESASKTAYNLGSGIRKDVALLGKKDL